MILGNPFFCVITYTSELKGSSMMMDTMGISIIKYTIENNKQFSHWSESFKKVIKVLQNTDIFNKNIFVRELYFLSH